MITTQIGNYPKVATGGYGTTLIGTLTRWERGDVKDTELERTCQDLTRAVIHEQEEAGLDLLTDGQIRWEDLVTPIARRLDGFEINGLTRWFDNNVYYRRPILRKRPARRAPILVEEYRFAAGCTDKPVKAVLPGPYSFVTLCEDRYYRRERPFVMRMAELLNAEALALAEAGAPVIQFDEPALGFGRPNMTLFAEALQLAVRGVAAKTAVATYFGRLDGILGSLGKAPVDIVGVDVVSDPGALGRLARTAFRKELALGCLDARTTKLERVEEIHRQLDVVRRRVPLDRVYLTPNCGLEFLPHAQALAKLRRLTQAARTYRAQPRER